MKKKILFFLPNLSGGGAEHVAINIIRQLNKNIFDIHLVLVNEFGDYIALIPPNVQIYNLGLRKTIYSFLKLNRLIKKIKPDIVFSTLIRTHIALYLALLKVARRPIIVLRSPNSPQLLIAHNKLNRITKYFLDKAYTSADIVLAQTPQMKDEVIKYHGVFNDRVHVLLNPLDTKYIDKKIQNIKNPFNSEYINVLASGRITEQKGFDILIKAFSKVVKINSNFHLYIIGEDVAGEKEKLLKMAQELKIEKHIHFLGFQKNPYRYYYFSDLFVLSSRWEGLPNTVLENLYLNKPIVATRCISYMSKLITDGKNGLLVDVDNIEDLANAILHYKTIDPKYSNKSFSDKSNVNELFLSFLENK